MKRSWVLLLSLLLAVSACEPDNGIRLTYSNGSEALEQIRGRLKKFGVRHRVEPQAEGFVVTLPGANASTAEQVKELLSSRGLLEFAFVIDGAMKLREGAQLPEGVVLSDERSASHPSSHLEGSSRHAVELAARQLELPSGRVLVSADEGHFRSWLVEERPVLTNDEIADAAESLNSQSNQAEVKITFTAQGGKAFADATEKGVGRRLAIILDGKVQSAPTVQNRIVGGTARITLGHAASVKDQLKEAEMLALTLRAGALPVVPTLAKEETYSRK